MENIWRRRELAEFLRSRRANIKPQQCGVKGKTRRRIAGLRREELAARCGVSASWYTKLEQGRDITISVKLLRNLADALALSVSDRMQLFMLGLSDLSPQLPADADGVIPAVHRMLEAMPHSPALIMTARMDYIGCNEAARKIFGDIEEFQDFSQLGRNILVSLFLSPPTRARLPFWHDSARYHVATFRAAYHRHANNLSFQALIDGLLSESPQFREIWDEHAPTPSRALDVLYKDGNGAPQKFEQFSLYADMFENIRVDIYTPLSP